LEKKLPDGWEWKRLGDYALVFNGHTPSRSEQRHFGHPVLKIKDTTEYGQFKGNFDSFVDDKCYSSYSSLCLIQDDTLILNAAHNSDYVGSKRYLVNTETEKAIPTGEWLVIRSNSTSLDNKYKHYIFQSEFIKNKIKSMVKGIHLYPKDVKDLRIPLPPLEAQKKIVAIVDKSENIRTFRRQSNQLTLNILQSLFLKMFGDPVRNPMQWRVVQIKDAIRDIKNGLSRRPNDSGDIDGQIVLRIKDIHSNWIDIENVRRFTLTDPEKADFLLKCGDLLVIRVNGNGDYVGRCAIFTTASEPVYYSDHVFRIRFKENQFDPFFVSYLLNSTRGRQLLTKHIRTSAGQYTINQYGLGETNLICPPLPLQEKFAEFFRTTKERNDIVAKQLVELEKMNSTVINKIIIGELVV
jgi:type I restriction enzyme S subunit